MSFNQYITLMTPISSDIWIESQIHENDVLVWKLVPINSRRHQRGRPKTPELPRNGEDVRKNSIILRNKALLEVPDQRNTIRPKMSN